MFCSCPKKLMQSYAVTAPTFDPRSYFNGPLRAWGMMQSRSGKVMQRFDLAMQGTWNGDTCTLDEQFSFYDGTKKSRRWMIRALPDGTYEGTASDVDGTAPGSVSGCAGHWNYLINLPMKGKTLKLAFDDWMFQMNDGVLINRTQIRKFGFRVAEMTIFMQKA